MKLLHRHESDKKYGKFGSAWLLFVLVLIGPIGPLWAASPAQAPSTPSPVNKQLVETKIKEVEARGDIDDATKAKLTELYRKTLSELETVASHDAAAAAFGAARTSAPGETAKTPRPTSRPPASRASPFITGATPTRITSWGCFLA